MKAALGGSLSNKKLQQSSKAKNLKSRHSNSKSREEEMGQNTILDFSKVTECVGAHAWPCRAQLCSGLQTNAIRQLLHEARMH